MKRIIVLITLLLSLSSMAKHTALNFTTKGLNKIVNDVVNSYQESKGTSTLTYSAKTVFERIPVSFFNENEVIQEINNFVPLNQKEDFIFYINSAPIKIDGDLINNSFKISTEGSKTDFNLYLSVSLENLKVTSKKIELCELKNWKCDREKRLYSKISNVSIKTYRKVDVGAVLNVKVNNGKIKLKFKELYTNLIAPKNSAQRAMYKKLGISSTPVKLDINFSDFFLPPLKVYIDGEVMISDFSKLKNAMLGHKEFLGKELALHAGRFVTNELVELVNTEVMGSMDNIKSKYSILDYRSQYSDLSSQIRNMYASSKINFPSNLSMMDKVKMLLKVIVSSAKYELEFTGAKSYNKKNLNLNFNNTFALNGKTWKFTNSLRNGKGTLASPSFSKMKNQNYDLAIAISEPLLNGALREINKTSFIQQIAKSTDGMEGVTIRKVHLHLEGEGTRTFKFQTFGDNYKKQYDFPTVAQDNTRVVQYNNYREIPNNFNQGSTAKPYGKFIPVEETTTSTKEFKTTTINTGGEIVIVAELMVKLSDLPTDGIGSWIENSIGSLVEGDLIWFPLEIRFKATLVKKEEKTFIKLTASNPIQGNTLVNNYDYVYKKMWGKVEDAVIKAVSEGLLPSLEKLPTIDITPYLKVKGLALDPKNIYIHKSGHIMISADIKELDISKLGKK